MMLHILLLGSSGSYAPAQTYLNIRINCGLVEERQAQYKYIEEEQETLLCTSPK